MSDARIADALLAVVRSDSGDWADVVARASKAERARRQRRRLTLALAFVLLLVTAGTTLALGNRLFDWFSVEASPEQAPTLPAAAPYVAGATFYRPGARPQQLSHPLLAPLLGQDAALAVLSPGGRYLAYHSALAHPPTDPTVVPLLYVHDSLTGRERLLARGAQTLAWSHDGRIAYFRATRARYDGRRGAYLGQIVVGTLTSPATRWTRTAGSYEALAWAHGRLLIAIDSCLYQNCAQSPPPGVYLLNPTGSLRPLHLATLAALSPDGRYAFGRYDPVPGQDSPSPIVRVVSIKNGAPVATLNLTRPMAAAGFRGQLPGAITRGAWRRDQLVVTFRGGSTSALVFLRKREHRLSLESIAQIAPQTLRTRYGLAFGAPIFASDTNVIVPIRGETLKGRYLVSIASCSTLRRRCLRGAVLPPRRWFAIAGNQSRPDG